MKLKTHRGAAKRFKKTGTGKIVRGSAFKRHILTSKTDQEQAPDARLEGGHTGRCAQDRLDAALQIRVGQRKSATMAAGG